MLPGEEHRDEHAQHLIVRQSAAVLVPRVDERLQDVGLARARLAARLDHLVEDGGELLASLVALAVRLDGGVGKKTDRGTMPLSNRGRGWSPRRRGSRGSLVRGGIGTR